MDNRKRIFLGAIFLCVIKLIYSDFIPNGKYNFMDSVFFIKHGRWVDKEKNNSLLKTHPIWYPILKAGELDLIHEKIVLSEEGNLNFYINGESVLSFNIYV